MAENLMWPDPVPCRPENPVQGIRQCEALRTGTKCRWLNVDYCGVNTETMTAALETLGLDDFTWLLEDDVDSDDLAEAVGDLADALSGLSGPSARSEAAGSVRWLLGLLKLSTKHGCGLSGRFNERVGTKDRY